MSRKDDGGKEGSDPSPKVDRRVEAFGMKINGGILESLGINMYTSIGKCLVEFVANAYDSEAATVDIRIPWLRIGELVEAAKDEEKKLKAELGADAAAAADAGGGDAAPDATTKKPVKTAVMPKFPDDVEIVIADDGHGMSPDDVRTKFMAINRKRRADKDQNETNDRSENGLRQVMGRKGLGKLAGFGAADTVEIWTKRRGETYATIFSMRFEDLQNAEDVSEVVIPAEYEDDLPAEAHGTTVTLRRIKRGSVSRGAQVILDTIANAFFGVDPKDFAINVNGRLVEERKAAYEYEYNPAPNEKGLTGMTVEVDGEDDIHLSFKVMFRARKKDEDNPELLFGPLAQNKRGARIYCNHRLAAGPTLLDLKTGMHNRYASDYLECIIEADDLDRKAIDFINTNRTQLREDNETVNAFHEAVRKILRDGIREHGKWRERKVESELNAKIAQNAGLRWIGGLTKARQKAARSVLKAMAIEHDLDSPTFGEVAPILMNAMNASDVFVKLIELKTAPESLEKIASHLTELAELERRDLIMHYRGRRNAIDALRDLTEEGEKSRKSDPRNEKALHQLLKENPWLVRPEFSGWMSSDNQMTTTLSKLAQNLGVDQFAKPHIPESPADTTRPDLVFLLAESDTPYAVTVVELKSTTLPLEQPHLNQLQRYMRQTEEWIRVNLQRTLTVHGLLIGKMPKSDTSNPEEQDLLDRVRKRQPSEPWEVVGLQAMLERTRRVHGAMITAAEREEQEEEAETKVETAPIEDSVAAA